ncbi:hypothetical protein CWE13_10715 [Aliidiomarina shirensis]|uniref:Adhesin domain-containing protein n=1 Tax=Aliidiomarina shirensis TaxID=1048642 RepID=A0A432WQF8_9GAMM|nr:hypothetical protein [Aliidiomarina shirensis]RUO36005.1 hypothetical protein CWE13_10715 [Aliidiomarina shirensis]
MKNSLFIGTLVAFASFSAHADLPCKESRSVDLALNAETLNMLEVAIGAGTLDIAGNDHDSPSLEIRMCASSQDRLDRMAATSSQRGNTAVLDLETGGRSNSFRAGLFRSANYGYFNISGSIPASWGMMLEVGSGSADIEHINSLRATVGSGTINAEHIAGHALVHIGSGEVSLEHAHNIEISTIGSGDFSAEHIAGAVTVGSIGSGSVELDKITGGVTVSTIGSGNLDIDDAGDDIRIGNLGSGRVVVRNIDGDVILQAKGSGSVRTHDVSGKVSIPD